MPDRQEGEAPKRFIIVKDRKATAGRWLVIDTKHDQLVDATDTPTFASIIASECEDYFREPRVGRYAAAYQNFLHYKLGIQEGG